MSEKKYRLAQADYDEHDRTYAANLRHHVCPEAFHEFTDNLMSETYISRFKLLDAIDDYKRAGLNKANPLLINFEDHAFNCRPHQPCIIS
jgi:hypothetical protein